MSITFFVNHPELDLRVLHSEACKLLELGGIDYDPEFLCGDLDLEQVHEILARLEDLLISVDAPDSGRYPTWRVIRCYGRLSRLEAALTTGFQDRIKYG